MMDQNTCFAYLNMELPDDIRRLKEAGRTSPCTRRARCR